MIFYAGITRYVAKEKNPRFDRQDNDLSSFKLRIVITAREFRFRA
jgi:hypothetical protein